METNKLQWKRIAKGDRLPCDSLLMEKDGTIRSIVTGAGVRVGQDAYYLSVEELRTLPKEESEDEKMRKVAIEFVKQNNSFNWLLGVSKEQVLDWLEKQGEHAKFRDSIQVGDKVTRNEDGVLVNLSQLNRVAKKDEKQGEQKPAECNNSTLKDKLLELFQRFRWYCKDETPTNGDIIEYVDAHIQELIGTMQNPAEWSEEDEEMHRKCICAMRASACGFPEEEKFVEQVDNWLKSLKDRVQPQPRQEWSEKDENHVKSILSTIECCKAQFPNSQAVVEAYNADIEWLKSLRPQSQWKLSE